MNDKQSELEILLDNLRNADTLDEKRDALEKAVTPLINSMCEYFGLEDRSTVGVRFEKRPVTVSSDGDWVNVAFARYDPIDDAIIFNELALSVQGGPQNRFIYDVTHECGHAIDFKYNREFYRPYLNAVKNYHTNLSENEIAVLQRYKHIAEGMATLMGSVYCWDRLGSAVNDSILGIMYKLYELATTPYGEEPDQSIYAHLDAFGLARTSENGVKAVRDLLLSADMRSKMNLLGTGRKAWSM